MLKTVLQQRFLWALTHQSKVREEESLDRMFPTRLSALKQEFGEERSE